MALPAGESPALRYLIKAEPPVRSAPSLSGCVTGIITPRSRMVTGEKLSVGDRIIGVTSSGLHANGVSLVIKRAMALKEQIPASTAERENAGRGGANTHPLLCPARRSSAGTTE